MTRALADAGAGFFFAAAAGCCFFFDADDIDADAGFFLIFAVVEDVPLADFLGIVDDVR